MSVRSIVFGLASAAATLLSSEMVLAAAGDDSANDIASRTAPGETASQSCGSSGFIVVTFRAGGTVVSTIESGTPCTPGGGGGGGGGISSSLPAELQAQLEQDLRAQHIQNDVDAFMQGLPNLDDALVDALGDLQALQDQEISEFTDEEKSALASQYRGTIASLRSLIAGKRSEITRLEGLIAPARARAEAATANARTVEAEARAAEAELARVRAEAANSPTGRALSEAETDLATLRSEIANLSQQLQSGTPNADYISNKLGAARLRADAALARVEQARSAHAAVQARVASASEAASQAREASMRADSEATGALGKVSEIQGKIARLRTENSSYQSEISEYQALIRALETQNQLAGPSGDAFETLRANGIEFWSRGSWFTADDTQSGRNQEVEQKNITLGVNGRLSERLLLGLAVSYIDGENTDQTGAGISSDTETFLFAPYLAYQLSEDLTFDASGVFGITDVSLTRATTATASYDATTMGGQVGLSLRHRLSQVISLTGRVGQSYVTTDSDGYTDTGGVTVASSDNEQAATSLSGRINVSTDPDWRWHGALKVRYDTIDPGNGVDRLHGTLSTGLEYNPGAYAVAVQANRSVFRSNYEATGFGLQVRVPF